jgi:hypothetical protein
VPENLKAECEKRLPEEFLEILRDFKNIAENNKQGKSKWR